MVSHSNTGANSRHYGMQRYAGGWLGIDNVVLDQPIQIYRAHINLRELAVVYQQLQQCLYINKQKSVPLGQFKFK